MSDLKDSVRSGPSIDEDTTAFWKALARHVIELQRCGSCGEVRFPPMPACPECAGLEFECIEVSGGGAIYSWITVRRPVGTIAESELPCTIVTVELNEGCRIVGRLARGVVPSIGSSVVAEFIEHDGWTELAFAPTADVADGNE
jgi:uncharacterized OB-fold protein